MNLPEVNEKIMMSFKWEGPNAKLTAWGPLDVRVVDLIIANAKTQISVHLPQNLPSDTAQKFSFTCYRNYNESHPDILNVTIEQIKNLTIKAGYFEESERKGPKIMDRNGKITQQKFSKRTDSKVDLELPQTFDIGQKYQLVIHSDNLSLKASLVKEEKEISTPYTEDQIIADQNELFPLLGGVLLPLIGLKTMEFGMKLSTMPSVNSILITHNVNDQTLGIESIKKEIQKINPNQLKEIMIKFRSAKEKQGKIPQNEQNALEKELFKLIFNALGDEGLMNIMRTNLHALIQGNSGGFLYENMLIEDISKRFKEICKKQVN